MYLIHFYATGRCCSLGPLTVQTLPPLAGPVSVSRVLARGTSLARLHQGPFWSSVLSTDGLIRDARFRGDGEGGESFLRRERERESMSD